MRTRTGYVALVLLSLSGQAVAQTAISEADALARLSEESPRVRAIRASVEISRAEVLNADRWPNPRVTYNRESVAGITESIVTVTQPLPISGRRGLEVSAASALVDASIRRADEDIRRARAELRAAYAELSAAQVREAGWTRARDRLRELADVLARREAAGEAAGYDRLRAEREVMDLEAERIAAHTDRARAQAVLASFFADAADATTIVAAAPATPPRTPLPGVDQLMTMATMTRGELQALQFEIDSARFAERAAAKRAALEPEVFGGAKSSNAAGGDVGGVIGVSATIPLFDRGAPERANARARIVQAETRAIAFHTTLAAQIAALRALVAERRNAADQYRVTSITTSEQLERIAQVSYEAGERGILELLDAFRSSATARTRQTVLDTAARQAEIELEFVSGWEIK